jgi:hypothetical protein
MIIYGLGSVMSIMYVTEVLFNKKIILFWFEFVYEGIVQLLAYSTVQYVQCSAV